VKKIEDSKATGKIAEPGASPDCEKRRPIFCKHSGAAGELDR